MDFAELNLPQEASNNVLQQPYGLLIHQLRHHIAQYRSHRVEPLVGLADVLQAHIVKQDLLDDEDGYRLG